MRRIGKDISSSFRSSAPQAPLVRDSPDSRRFRPLADCSPRSNFFTRISSVTAGRLLCCGAAMAQMAGLPIRIGIKNGRCVLTPLRFVVYLIRTGIGRGGELPNYRSRDQEADRSSGSEPHRSYNMYRNSHGTDSPSGCGSNSFYITNWLRVCVSRRSKVASCCALDEGRPLGRALLHPCAAGPVG